MSALLSVSLSFSHKGMRYAVDFNWLTININETNYKLHLKKYRRHTINKIEVFNRFIDSIIESKL